MLLKQSEMQNEGTSTEETPWTKILGRRAVKAVRLGETGEG